MVKITIKNNPEYNGVDFGVPFVDGVAETENAWLIAMFEENGYTVEEITEEAEPKAPKAPAKKTTTKKEG